MTGSTRDQSKYSSENIHDILLHFILCGTVNLQRSENGITSGSYEMFKGQFAVVLVAMLHSKQS
jgi:hypothetical protein